MREGKRLSSFLFVLGLLVLFQKATQMDIDFLTLMLIALISSLWSAFQMEHRQLRILQGLAVLGTVMYVLAGLVPRPMAFMAHFNVYQFLHGLGTTVLSAQNPLAIFFEVIEYIINPGKTQFYHFGGLALIFTLLTSEICYRMHSHKQAERFYLAVLIISGLLWFTYIDVWGAFSCFFTAYVVFRLTEHGKGLLFGAVLPVMITLSAFLVTAATPINAINETLSQWRTESSWLRSATFFAAGGNSFELKQLGFYPLDQRLGGPVKLSKEVYFRIQTNQPKLYLRGRALTTYSGKSWKQEEAKSISFKIAKPVATSRMEYMLYDFKDSLSTVLAPMSVIQTNLPQEALKFENDQILSYEGDLKRDYNDGVSISGYDFSTLAPAEIEPYLQLPSNYSPEVIALTRKIIGNAQSDRAKIERIRRYLLSHYSYALAVGVPPEGQDFVESFLLNETQGYCVYFATASAVMARISGIPSRYVEGFVTPDTLIPGRDTPVSGERAHAWSEVFYDDSWHILETTPTFTALTPEETATEAIEPLPGALEDLASEKTEEDMAVNLVPSSDENPVRSSSYSLPILMLICCLLVLGVLWLRLKSIRGLGLKKRQALYIQWLLLGLCERYEITQPERLTAREILEKSAVSSPQLGLLPLVEIIEKSLYDSSGCSEEECSEIEKVYWTLYHKHFNTAMKLKWGFKIAGKGRILNGFNGENSTA